jgi:hypothetical protein
LDVLPGNESSNEVSFPHPEAGQEHDRDDDITNTAGILWKVLKRAIDVSDNRNAEDNVNGAKDGTFGGGFHD